MEVKRLVEEPWLFSAIYASPDSSLRRDLWCELERTKNNYQWPWLVASDFNETSSMNESVGIGGSKMV